MENPQAAASAVKGEVVGCGNKNVARAARRLGKSYVWHLCSVEIKQKENCQCSVHVEKVRDDLI